MIKHVHINDTLLKTYRYALFAEQRSVLSTEQKIISITAIKFGYSDN